MQDLTEFEEDEIPDPEDQDHVDAMFELLGPTATLRQARALAEYAAEKGTTFRELAYLLKRAAEGSSMAAWRLDRFIRLALMRLK
jgi:ATP phosphoribosyltransferase regulatory subunit HisZ